LDKRNKTFLYKTRKNVKFYLEEKGSSVIAKALVKKGSEKGYSFITWKNKEIRNTKIFFYSVIVLSAHNRACFTVTPRRFRRRSSLTEQNRQGRDSPPWKFAKIVALALHLLVSLTFYVPEVYFRSFRLRKTRIYAIDVSVLRICTVSSDGNPKDSSLLIFFDSKFLVVL
jgi:hypothetical protein